MRQGGARTNEANTANSGVRFKTHGNVPGYAIAWHRLWLCNELVPGGHEYILRLSLQTPKEYKHIGTSVTPDFQKGSMGDTLQEQQGLVSRSLRARAGSEASNEVRPQQ